MLCFYRSICKMPSLNFHFAHTLWGNLPTGGWRFGELYMEPIDGQYYRLVLYC